MKDLKYITSFSIPATAVIGLGFQGIWVFLTPVFAFILVPILEVLLPVQNENLSEAQIKTKAKHPFFDLLLYLNLPIVYTIVGYFLWSLTWANYNTSALIGLTFSVGIVVGSNGINVAHELGHRRTQWEKTLGKALLLPALYMHFYVEHNFGHHQNAATKEDPASARYNQTVYSFWFTSIYRQYKSAWKLQQQLLRNKDKSILSIYNDMFWYSLLQLGYLVVIFIYFGKVALFVAIAIGVIAALLLESINYIEHYGLSRQKTNSGRYERVKEIHSWNSNHILGRMMLYELTRHSDHHYRSHKKYQLLDCHETSPQMPYGYPTSMVLALFPPLWFSIMNKRIPMEMRS
ncbi:alkane 1-monooxygenase [Candidatus Ulvibacter alkanivorans]|uniref:alkane 1-monooxygenase n=1 Tax=Candidatus Ulvibacter alkanivorans TaxID=2267620 RepID=UPI000DF3681A|nr:alkane 1-monooxygenase [Candidatus Ulvibacter alkanivorans]